MPVSIEFSIGFCIGLFVAACIGGCIEWGNVSRASEANSRQPDQLMFDWALFVSAFLSATLLPGSSEALLLLRLGDGVDPVLLVWVATLGNLLGSLLTYAMGRGGNWLLHARWLRINQADVTRAETWFERWGKGSLLFAWLPIVGDPLCLLAGILKLPLIWFVVLVGFGKLLRYSILAWAFV